MIKLTIPTARSEIIVSLEALVDKELQKSWYSKTAKHRFWDSLDYYVFDYLFNTSPDLLDYGLNIEDENPIGINLYDSEERQKISDLLMFFKYCGFEPNMPDDYYVNHEEWPKLMKMTEEVVGLMKSNNEKYNFQQNLSEYEKEDEARGYRGPD